MKHHVTLPNFMSISRYHMPRLMKWLMHRLGAVSVVVVATIVSADPIMRVAPDRHGMSADRLGRVRDEMNRLVDEDVVPGMSGMIARRGEVVFEHVTGLLDVQTGDALQLDSLMRVYSMTKPVTSVAAMMLVEQGKLGLDAPLARHFPEWAAQSAYEGETIVPVQPPMAARHLLMHTSGLSYGYYGDTVVDRMYREAGLIDDWDYLTHDTRELVVKLADIPLLFQPGQRWHYGFSSDVLGHLIERVSGQRLDRFFEENIFEPLDMQDVYFDVPERVHDRFGTDQWRRDGQWVVQDSPREDPEFVGVTFLSGGGGLVMTVEAYLRFGLMVANGGQLGGRRILSPTTVDLMTTDLLPAGLSAGGSGFGLGFAIARGGEHRGVLTPGSAHWGGAAGTFFWIDPVEELVAVFMMQRIGTPATVQTTMRNLVYASIEQSFAR